MTTPTTPRPGPRHLLVIAVSALVGAVVAALLAPAGLGRARTGDADLVTSVEQALADDRGLGAVSVVWADADGVRFAGLGQTGGRAPDPDTGYELGSITKTFTGMLLADAVERGEVRLDDRLGQHLPRLAGTPAGGVSLASLASHTSGLPRLPSGMGTVGPFLATLGGGDPYPAWSVEQAVDAAASEQLSGEGEFRYSNLGVSLLGHALAGAAGADGWPELVTERLFRPLGMTDTHIIASRGPEPSGLAHPSASNGWPVGPWTGLAWAPSGAATRTTARDLGRFLSALLDGRAPGSAALEPRSAAGEGRVGLAWLEDDGLTWHNGGTGGSSTFIALDRAAGRGVAVLNNTDRSVDPVGVRLLRPDAAAAASDPPLAGFVVGAVGAGLAAGLVGLLWRPRGRARTASAFVDAATGLLLAAVAGPWGWTGWWLYGALAGGVLGTGGVVALRRGRGGAASGPEGRGSRWSRVGSLVLSALVLAAVAVAAFGPQRFGGS